ncbi:C-GCAxxG-C-C family (seleno)protein, partial [Chloroflexota bacterium]
MLVAGGVGTLGLALGANARPAQANVEWPLPYVPLDVEVVQARGHLGYYNGECCYGAFWAILETLRDEVGGPYNEIPAEIMIYGGGGIAGWGTTCGALIGSCSAMALAAPDRATAKGLANALLGWYSTVALPSDTANDLAVEGGYLVDELRAEGVLPSSVSNSPLCHVSVGNWCEVSGFASGSPERSERCGRLVGDTAAQAVALLNTLHAEGSVTPDFSFTEETQECMGCHFKGPEYNMGQFTQGKMECPS